MFAPTVLLGSVTVVLLTVIWSIALNYAARERILIDRTAAALTAELAGTYEAQVVRALREIDTTLKLVRYSLGDGPAQKLLEDLRAGDLLPPALLFVITVTDVNGTVVAGTHQSAPENVAAREYFQQAQEADGLIIGKPRPDQGSGEWWLTFSRRLEISERQFSGIVTVSVHAGYFVSGYEPETFGKQGVLGLVGTDGVFRVRRTGDRISAGARVNYNELVPRTTRGDVQASVTVNSWDGLRRYTVVRKLYEFPLAIVVGLAEAEQLASAARLERTYMWRAGLASLLLIAVVALLARLSWQLQKARTRVMEERTAHSQRVEYLAYHDNLTALPNRALFSQLLSQGMQHARRYEKQLALLFLDLDHFKAVNDSLGHDAGDELLQEVARRLKKSVRESDVVARLGGDEFVILLLEVNDGAQVISVADKILAAISSPFTLTGHDFRVTVSIGVALYPVAGEDEQTLMKNADAAMYHAKEKGKNTFHFYGKDVNTDSLERFAPASDLRNALKNQELLLFYQSKKDLNTGRIAGIEALLRWQHPDLGLIMPRQFIPPAEENGLIIPIGRWVINTACRQNVKWQSEGFPKVPMAVNLSERQFFDKGLLPDITRALQETGMAPGLLELEISETMIRRDMNRTSMIFQELKRVGVRLTIDNFGTGYSSLAKWQGLPLDILKINGSFIRNMDRGDEATGLTEALIALGKRLGLTVVVEGVESEEQVAFLRSHFCDQVQGIYINRPMPADDFFTAVRERLQNAEDGGPSGGG